MNSTNKHFDKEKFNDPRIDDDDDDDDEAMQKN